MSRLGALSRPVSLFASALAEQALAPQLAPADERAGAVTLPGVLLDGIEAGGRWGAMRIEVLRHVVQLQSGGRWLFSPDQARALGLVGPRGLAGPGDALAQCLRSWPRPVLLRRLFLAIDARRVEARIATQFPGVRAELRAPGPAGHPPRWLPRRLLCAADPALQAPLLAHALHAEASVYDSLRAAIGVAALLGWGRHRGHAPLPQWLTIEAPAADTDEPASDEGFAGTLPLAPADGVLLQALRHARVRIEASVEPLRRAPQAGQPERETAPAVAGRPPLDTPARAQGRLHSRHDEWHYVEQRYLRAWTQVQEHRLQGEDLQYLTQLRRRHATLAASIRRHIGKLRPQGRLRLRRQSEGDEIDFDAALAERVERHAGHGGSGRVYTALQPARREVCAAFLLDISGSTGFLVPQASAPQAVDEAADDDPYFYASPRRSQPPPPARRRVIDVAMDAIGLMCDALAALGDRHAVYGFSGDGREQVDFYVAKGFDEAWSAAAAAALARMEPKGSTRTGAALRHAARQLARQPEPARLLIVVSDGYPQDSDYGPDPQDVEYGLRDTAQAMKEAERAGLAVFFVSVDHAAHDYLRRLCPASRYLVIDEVAGLPEQLAKVYRRLLSCR